MNLLIRFMAAAAGGLLLWAGFPPLGQPWLVWIGLVPLLLVMEGRGAGVSFLLSYLSGMVFFVGIFQWILQVPGYTYLHHAILGVYLSSYFGLFGLAFSIVSRRVNRTAALFSAPFLWVSKILQRYDMGTPSLHKALSNLIKKDLVRRGQDKKYTIIDNFLAEWIKEVLP